MGNSSTVLSVDLQEPCAYIRIDGGGAAWKSSGVGGQGQSRGPLSGAFGTGSERPAGESRTVSMHLTLSFLLSVWPLSCFLPRRCRTAVAAGDCLN
eukprot:10250482-Alexandrium_andersonii.AAC.1